jgi:hypothetical protein
VSHSDIRLFNTIQPLIKVFELGRNLNLRGRTAQVQRPEQLTSGTATHSRGLDTAPRRLTRLKTSVYLGRAVLLFLLAFSADLLHSEDITCFAIPR